MNIHIPDDAKGIRYEDLDLKRQKFNKTDDVISQPNGHHVHIGFPLAYFHHWENGQQKNQGFLDQYEEDGTSGVVLASYLTGLPNKKIFVSELYLERCTFYLSTHEMMLAHRPYVHEDKE